MSFKSDIDINKLVSNREAFNEFVYTPVDKAIKLLGERQKNGGIVIPSDIPNFLSIGLNAVLSRHITTSNYENIRFLNIANAIDFNPIFWEYNDDKFTSNNKLKHALGKIHLYINRNNNNGDINTKNITIIDFNDSGGKIISEIKTKWGQPLVDFHHELLLRRFPSMKNNIFNASSRFLKNGACSKGYYKSLLYPFVKHGILFENFSLDSEELPLTKEVVIPAIIEIMKETKLKPLIVALEPTEIESDRFWLCHPKEDGGVVLNKMKNII